jgi:hypothetical protein
MPTMKLRVPHALSREKAVCRVQTLLEESIADRGGEFDSIDLAWTNHSATFSCRARGITVTGSLDVAPDAVAVRAKIPLAALPLRGQVKGYLTHVLTRALRGG